MKDQLVELERQNAVLLAEKDNLTAQISSQEERVNESGSQLAVLLQQLATVWPARSVAATLQAENSTLASQLDSTTAQKSGLHFLWGLSIFVRFELKVTNVDRKCPSC